MGYRLGEDSLKLLIEGDVEALKEVNNRPVELRNSIGVTSHPVAPLLPRQVLQSIGRWAV